MTKNNQIENKIAVETLEKVVVNVLLEGEIVVVPDFGYLELKSFSERRTVLFKSADTQRFCNSQSLEEGSLYSMVFNAISVPLKEGKVVSFKRLGVFRPIEKEGAGFRVSFTPSLSLRKRLSGESDEADDSESVPVTSISENGLGETNQEIIVSTSDKAPQAKPKRSASDKSRTAKVGDVIIPGEDDSRRKKVNFWGVMLIIGTSVLVFAVILTNILTNNKNAVEAQPVEVTQSEEGTISLPALAEQHYGNPAFWVYIFEANQDKLVSPINVPKHVLLTIPDLSEYAVDAKDSMEIARANMLSETILEQFRK